MESHLKQKAELLGRLATSRGIDWKTEADALPEGDVVARIGLLADRLGVGLSEALDPSLGEEEYIRRIEEPTNG